MIFKKCGLGLEKIRGLGLCKLFQTLKGRVHCFSMQVVMNKCFILIPKKIWRRSVLSLLRKTQKGTLYFQKRRSPSWRL